MVIGAFTIDRLELLRAAATWLLVAFWLAAWWSCVTAWQDGDASGDTPASRHWVLGQGILALGITVTLSPLVLLVATGRTVDRETAALLVVFGLLLCTAGKLITRRGFAIHRDAGYVRRDGPGDRYDVSD